MTAVREQPTELKCTCTRVAAHTSECARSAAEALVRPAPEPAQADASVLLDLLEQVRAEAEQWMPRGPNGPYRRAAGHLARIAELVQQQPSQARNRRGRQWWIHDCGDNVLDLPERPIGCEDCAGTGPWRPLLVGLGGPR